MSEGRSSEKLIFVFWGISFVFLGGMGIIPDCAQDLILALLSGITHSFLEVLYGILAMGPGSVMYKSSNLLDIYQSPFFQSKDKTN